MYQNLITNLRQNHRIYDRLSSATELNDNPGMYMYRVRAPPHKSISIRLQNLSAECRQWVIKLGLQNMVDGWTRQKQAQLQMTYPRKRSLKNLFAKIKSYLYCRTLKGFRSWLRLSTPFSTGLATRSLTHPSRLVEDVDPVENDVFHAAPAISFSVTSVR